MKQSSENKNKRKGKGYGHMARECSDNKTQHENIRNEARVTEVNAASVSYNVVKQVKSSQIKNKQLSDLNEFIVNSGANVHTSKHKYFFENYTEAISDQWSCYTCRA